MCIFIFNWKKGKHANLWVNVPVTWESLSYVMLCYWFCSGNIPYHNHWSKNWKMMVVIFTMKIAVFNLLDLVLFVSCWALHCYHCSPSHTVLGSSFCFRSCLSALIPSAYLSSGSAKVALVAYAFVDSSPTPVWWYWSDVFSRCHQSIAMLVFLSRHLLFPVRYTPVILATKIYKCVLGICW